MDLLHVTSAEAWAEASRSGVHAPPMLEQDGFLHLCTAAQLDHVLGRHFAGRTGLVLLHIDPAQLGDLRWENSEASRDAFPHLYGPLPVAAVIRVEPLQP
jgi:uncharacterized protein (DUF952 family)